MSRGKAFETHLSKKAAKFSGVAGEFADMACLASQISKALPAMQPTGF
jgi:hypothetical protein